MADVRRLKVISARDLYAADGSPVPVRDVHFELTYVDNRLSEATGSFAMDFATWQAIDAAESFHLTAEGRGPTFGGGLNPELDVEIEARLDEAVARELADSTSDDWEVAAVLYGADADTPLARTESWYAMFVKQSDGPLKVGFSTRWSPVSD